MPQPLFSQSWYRVAGLKPRLRQHAEIHRQVFRGQRWYVIHDHASGRFHRLSPAAYRLVGAMDGGRSLQEIWEAGAEELGDDLPPQDDLIRLVGQLHGSDLVQCQIPPDLLETAERAGKRRRAELLARIKNPLALRLPLIDPDRFLGATLPLVRPLFGWLGLALWLTVCLTGGALVAQHWAALSENLADRVLAVDNLVLLLLVYPAVKVLHELGHGYAAKRWGAAVHEMGVMFLVFVPVPYVDASAASAFANKWQRALVGAAGILVELFLAAAAAIVWAHAEPGLLRAAAFNVMLIGGVSTLLFNGNPLLRFDGYYVLSDLIEIPNLGRRANLYLLYLIRRKLFGLKELRSPVTARGEAAWFVGYGLAALVYRLFIVAVIALFVATQFFFIGVALALLAVFHSVLLPIGKGLKYLLASPQLQPHRGRALAVSGAFAAVLAAVLGLLPLPHFQVAEGVVRAPEGAQLHSGGDGVVAALLSEPGQAVAPGQAILQLSDPALEARLAVLAARRLELALRRDVALVEDLTEAAVLDERLRQAEEELALARARSAALVVRSPMAGRLVLPAAADLPGRFLRKGALVGHILSGEARSVRVVVGQDMVDLVRSRTRAVELRFARAPETVRSAVLQREVPAASRTLPSRVLSSQGGGAIALDPTDREGQSLQSHFGFDLQVTAPAAVIGELAYVRFDHGHSTLAWRLYRAARLLFLREFDV